MIREKIISASVVLLVLITGAAAMALPLWTFIIVIGSFGHPHPLPVWVPSLLPVVLVAILWTLLLLAVYATRSRSAA